MIESIYIDSNQTDGLEKTRVNHLMVVGRNLTPKSWENLKKFNAKLSIAIDAFDKGECPANPESLGKLSERIEQALKYQPSEIWLDRFRFGGDCTDINDSDADRAHQPCQFCKDADRVGFINGLAGTVQEQANDRAKIGYFTVAFFSDRAKKLKNALGLDYQKLAKFFDLSSPMLYHRMLHEPVEYISEYVSWMVETTGKPVLPIIQIKDMPDDLPDKMSENEIWEAFNEAKEEPSIGVAIFWWQHALEKNKTSIVSGLFTH